MDWSKYDFAKRDFNEVKEEVETWNSKASYNELDLIVFFKNVLGKAYTKNEWSKSYGDYDVYQEVKADNTHLVIVERTFHTDSYEGRRTEESSRIVEDYSKSWQEYLLRSYRIDKDNLLKSLYVEDILTQKEAEKSIAEQKQKIKSLESSLSSHKTFLDAKEKIEKNRKEALSERVANLDPESQQTNIANAEMPEYNLFNCDEELSNDGE